MCESVCVQKELCVKASLCKMMFVQKVFVQKKVFLCDSGNECVSKRRFASKFGTDLEPVAWPRCHVSRAALICPVGG